MSMALHREVEKMLLENSVWDLDKYQLAMAKRSLQEVVNAKMSTYSIPQKKVRKYDMGQWAMRQIESERINPNIRYKIKTKYSDEIIYFVNYKPPKLPEDLKYVIDKYKEVLFVSGMKQSLDLK